MYPSIGIYFHDKMKSLIIAFYVICSFGTNISQTFPFVYTHTPLIWSGSLKSFFFAHQIYIENK